MGRSRDFGLNGAGKGDDDRTTDRAAFNAGMAEIPFDGNVPGFCKVGLKQVKTYGRPAKANLPEWQEVPPAEPGTSCALPPYCPPFAETEGEWAADAAAPGTDRTVVSPTTDIIRE